MSAQITVNGVEVAPVPDISDEMLAAQELLRQRAVEAGLLDAAADDPGVIQDACEALLAREVVTPTPTEEECRHYYSRHPDKFISGELVHLRHILFQVTQGTPVPKLRAKAEETLNALLADPSLFEEMAKKYSNCPSSKQGGNLGQLGRGDTVPEFEKAAFKMLAPTGLLKDVIKTRFGFHIISVDRRIRGDKLPFEMAKDQISKQLLAEVEERAVRQYLSVLAARAVVGGVQLETASSPLVQ